MQSSEFLAFIPLLIYGIALADLLGEWKRLLEKEGRYVPYLVMTLILTEMAVYNVFIYARLIAQMEGQPYTTYLSFLLPPFLFLLTVNAFTPDEGTDTKTYFQGKMRVFFSLMAVFVASHFLYTFGESDTLVWVGRGGAILLCVYGAVSQKPWIAYVLFVFWLVTFIAKGDLVAP